MTGFVFTISNVRKNISRHVCARQEFLAYLSDFAVAFRYPGESADKKAAVEAKRLCIFFRKIARSALGLRT